LPINYINYIDNTIHPNIQIEEEYHTLEGKNRE
jgi:hypothetical protein